MNTASDLATAVILGVKSTSDDVTVVPIGKSPLTVMAAILNTFEVEASIDMSTCD